MLYEMKKKTNSQAGIAKDRELRDQVVAYMTDRLSRGSIRLQSGAYASESEWHERRTTQPERIARINERLGES